MSYIKQLTSFFIIVANDNNIKPTQIALFMALFQKWNQSRFKGTIKIYRDEIMLLAKISSKATYHKSMAILHKQRYIMYSPSYNIYSCSEVTFFPTDTKPFNSLDNEKNQPVQNLTTYTKFDPVQNLTARPLNEPNNKLYNTNIINHNISRARNQKSKNNLELNGQVNNQKKEKNSAKKEKDIATDMPPVLVDVENFFNANNAYSIEAQKFFNYYTANGWLVGGRSPMKDWKAAASNWIANSANYSRRIKTIDAKMDRAKHLNSKIDKDYSEPL